MLSILIPIYNYGVQTLVGEIHKMAIAEGIPFEIICIDDASNISFPENEKLTELEYVQFEKLSINIGRSALRNLLAAKAQYENLLFIDTDMAIVNPNFMHTYVEHCNSYDVIYGGILYEEILLNKAHVLRWKYGIKREALNPEQRREDPYFSVKTCNLLIKKKAFDQIKFNEQIREYGHEDTLFSIDIAKQQLKVLHIDNPLFHLGLEDAATYLQKINIACNSLSFMAKNYLNENEKDHIRLIYYYTRLQKMGLLVFVKIGYRLFEKAILKNLKSEDPSLKLLDLYKLMAYAKHQQ